MDVLHKTLHIIILENNEYISNLSICFYVKIRSLKKRAQEEVMIFVANFIFVEQGIIYIVHFIFYNLRAGVLECVVDFGRGEV